MDHGLPLTGFASAGAGASGAGNDEDEEEKGMPDEEAVVSFAGEDGNERFDLASLSLAEAPDGKAFVVRLFSEHGAAERGIEAEALWFAEPVTGRPLSEAEAPPAGGGCGGGGGVSSHDDIVDDGSGMVKLHRHVRGPRYLPAKVERRGRYGYSVEFADGAAIIYSRTALARAAGGTISRRREEEAYCSVTNLFVRRGY